MKRNPVKEALLRVLRAAPGQWQSGEALAEAAGVTRSAVWKAAGELRAEGFPLESAPRRGYRLEAGGDLLTREELLAHLGAGWQVECRPALPSTNRRARELALAGAPAPLLVAAAEQTEGKGRRGRSFFSPAGSGLYFSLLLRPALAASDAPLVTAAAAVAARRALAVFGVEVGVKWVNDLWLQGRKVCGILTEAATGFESGLVEHLIVGFGLNLTEPEGGFPPALAAIAGPVFASGTAPGRAALAAAVTREFLPLLGALPEKGFLPEYRAASILPGRCVTVLPALGEPYEATAGEIDDDGRLAVFLPDGERRLLHAGEVRLHPH